FKGRADGHAALAEAGYATALEAVDRMLEGLERYSATGVPGAESSRRTSLVEAQRLYEAYLKSYGDRRELRLRTARAHYNLSAIHSWLGEIDASDRHRRAAIADYESLLALTPGDPALVLRLARSWHGIASTAEKRGRAAEAAEVHERVLGLLREALARA